MLLIRWFRELFTRLGKFCRMFNRERVRNFLQNFGCYFSQAYASYRAIAGVTNRAMQLEIDKASQLLCFGIIIRKGQITCDRNGAGRRLHLYLAFRTIIACDNGLEFLVNIIEAASLLRGYNNPRRPAFHAIQPFTNLFGNLAFTGLIAVALHKSTPILN